MQKLFKKEKNDASWQLVSFISVPPHPIKASQLARAPQLAPTLPAISETLPAYSRALSAGSIAHSAGSRALTTGSETPSWLKRRTQLETQPFRPAPGPSRPALSSIQLGLRPSQQAVSPSQLAPRLYKLSFVPYVTVPHAHL